uniref:SAM domain-containing protein n=1 Tax=Plectus sambesii TaxID=2011161 RepID=A0A914UMC0_9BILA
SSTQASVATNHTLRGDSPPSRNSVHSSSSGGSLGSGSMERLDEGTYTPVSQLNVVDLVMNGVPDADVLAAWLHDLRFEEYLQLFLGQGYDVPTVARMTPEDLTAIGITKPGHRKRLTTEIHRWRVTDSWPTVPPAGGLREWLRAIGLPEYVPLFETQGYSQLKEVLQLTWEDFEDIGITRLGHLKKLGLAIKKLKDHRLGVASAQQPSSGEMMLINVPNGRTTVEVKPYSHQPSNGLNTFQQTSASPSHLMHPAAAPSTDAYGTFPRRNGHAHNLIMTEAIVHDGGRPMVEVRPVSKMSSQEVLSHDYDDWLHEDSPKKHSLFAVASSSSYANANLHGDLDLPEQKKSIRLNLHSPGRILSDGRPPLAPKRQSSVPPPAPSSQQRLDSSGDSDDYPPPPAPIACEGPIRRLRSVISVGGNPAVLDSMPLPDSSRSSTSSTEALPFANENCGTIRSRNDGVARSASTTNATLGSSSSSRRSARDVFADPGANMVDSRRPQNGLDGNGDVLNDIGHMLQNLTDELDALLCPAVSRT